MFIAFFATDTKVVFAEEGIGDFSSEVYQELAELPDNRPPDARSSKGPIAYLEKLYYFALTMAVILAVVMIIIAGVEYTAYGASEEVVSDAKHRITYAVIGLVLALASWLLLYIINPKLVDGNLLLPSSGITSVGGPTTTSPGARSAEYTAAELAIREELRSKGVTVTGSICTTVQQTDCTSLSDVARSAIDTMIALKAACNCVVNITGGAEAGHSTHGPGLAVLDLSDSDSLIRYLTNNREFPLSCGAVYKGEYRYETRSCVPRASGPHFHFVLGGVSPI